MVNSYFHLTVPDLYQTWTKLSIACQGKLRQLEGRRGEGVISVFLPATRGGDVFRGIC